ncbi:LacI family transcriptional regulator/LacI family xylobiose transport system transcriptional regulator [Streptomyces sp. SLBN-118]|uniref:substrate-binding domain-containing protein n=1 Tax=Streptomyces sp. SLBN-118 TaxID=2768454 RepID=UPI00116A06B8|nr:substrate-binding domain-containing protein [Streptomyces sp. SLBN-118]TQK50172.1 LacI family transcriptional regulator/LacI family xylobiose transport system transcriptional regulator [Streptomyces sp. SLBN-118]
MSTRATQSGSRATLVDLVTGEPDSSWVAELLAGIEQVAHEHGVGVAFHPVHYRATPGMDWLDSLAERGTAGIIAARTGLNAYQRREIAGRGIPAVLVDATDHSDDALPSVTATSRHGALTAAQHLTGLGHRRIAVIGGPSGSHFAGSLVAGYREALTVAHIPYDPFLVRFGGFRQEEGHRHAWSLLRARTPPTAILTGSTTQALGVYKASRDLGVRVPDGLSVVGFDDLTHASWISPSLTTVRRPLREIGGVAMRMVTTLMDGGELTVVRAELATHLVLRHSTAAPHRRTR